MKYVHFKSWIFICKKYDLDFLQGGDKIFSILFCC